MSLTFFYAVFSGHPILYGPMKCNPNPIFYVLLLLGGISAYCFKTTLTFQKLKKQKICHFFYSLSHHCFNLRNFDAILWKNAENVHFFENLLGSTKTYSNVPNKHYPPPPPPPPAYFF